MFVNLTSFEQFPVDSDAHRVDADVVDVVGLVEHDHRVSRQIFRDDFGDFRIQNVMVTVHDDLSLTDDHPEK